MPADFSLLKWVLLAGTCSCPWSQLAASLEFIEMVSRISDVPGCPGVDLELVLVPWMLVDLEADRHQCDLQRGTRVVNLLG